MKWCTIVSLHHRLLLAIQRFHLPGQFCIVGAKLVSIRIEAALTKVITFGAPNG